MAGNGIRAHAHCAWRIRFIGVWVGAALAVPFLVRAVAETQKVRTLTAIVAVSVPVLLYAAFVLFVIVVLGWD